MNPRLFVPFCFATLLFARSAATDPFVFVDTTFGNDRSPGSLGVGGGWLFGRGRVQVGFVADVYHSHRLDRFAPDTELYASLGWTVNDRWYFSGNLGGGAALNNGSLTWSLRSFLILTSLNVLAARFTLFAQWSPDTSATFLQARFGPSIRIGGRHRLFPNLGLGISIPGTAEPISASFTPGCVFILNL